MQGVWRLAPSSDISISLTSDDPYLRIAFLYSAPFAACVCNNGSQLTSDSGSESKNRDFSDFLLLLRLVLGIVIRSAALIACWRFYFDSAGSVDRVNFTKHTKKGGYNDV